MISQIFLALENYSYVGEISQLSWFEDIFVSQKIYAILYDSSFIAIF
jgi:hypothetical protein